MADALVKDAPLKSKSSEMVEILGVKVKVGSREENALSQEFDPKKKYVFQLANENMPFELPIWDMRLKRAVPDKKYKPSQNLVMTSQIVWNGARTNLRYYDGCETPFVSAQPREKDQIDQLIQQTKKRNFLDGTLIVEGYDRMLLLYLFLCSWNAESEFRTTTANQIFIPMNADKKATQEENKLDKIEEAMSLAKKATLVKMKVHSEYLGISMIEYHSGNELTEKEIRTEYRKAASSDPVKFIESYGNTSLETKYFINKALETGVIHNKSNANKATWGKSNNIICDISGLRNPEAISQRLFEFSQSEEGEEFLIQLKALYQSS